MRRDGLSKALIPSDAPGWLDRFTVALAIVGGLGVTATMLWELFAARPVAPQAAADDVSAVPGG
jgi:hypothetical protein